MTNANEKFKLKWIEQGEAYEKELVRLEVMAVFYGLYKGFAEDNEISEKLVKILPDVEWIKINKDHNETQEVPCITYKANDIVGVMKIIRHHKIVWTILNTYCTKD